MQKSFASKFLMRTLCLLFPTGIILIVTMPWSIDFLLAGYSLDRAYRSFMVVFFTVEGLMGLLILRQLIIMVSSIEKNPFTMKNVNIMRRLGILAFVMAASFFIKCYFYFSVMTLASGFMLILFGLSAFTLCDLLCQAVSYKEENDLTI